MEKIIVPREYDFIARTKAINSLCEGYGFIKKSVIGKSCGGKSIYALKIGADSEYPLIAAAFHGSERITSTVLLMFIEELSAALKSDGFVSGIRVKQAMKGRGVIFIPTVNPDGCDISLLGAVACADKAAAIGKMCNYDFSHWNSNLRGVDINHNFNADWENVRKAERKIGIYGPSPSKFGGFKPESEPETVALTELCRSVEISHTLALHSQGEVIYWSFGDSEPYGSRRMAEILATSANYALDTPHGTAVGGGFKDWFISEFNRPGFTAELGLGENPLPAEDSEKIYHRVREMLMLATVM